MAIHTDDSYFEQIRPIVTKLLEDYKDINHASGIDNQLMIAAVVYTAGFIIGQAMAENRDHSTEIYEAAIKNYHAGITFTSDTSFRMLGSIDGGKH